MNIRGLSVKPDTVMKVLRCILNDRNVSISDIAESCNVSRQTATGIVGYFSDKNLLVRALQKEKVRSGMRPERYRMNPKYNCIVCSVSSARFRAKLINADGKVLHNVTYSDGERTLDEEDFVRFAKDFNGQFSGFREEYRFGCSVVFSERDFFGTEITDDRTLADVRAHLTDIVRAQTSAARIAVSTREALAGEYFAHSRPFADKTVVYLCLNRDRIYSAAIVGGKRITGASGRGFDAYGVRFDRIRSSKFMLQNRRSPDDLADVIAFICADACAFYDPHLIYLDTEDYRNMAGLCEIVKDFLSEKYDLPGAGLPIIGCTSAGKISVVDRGACTVLRNLLLDDIEGKIYR